MTSSLPLVVDLDGTLTPIDTLHESAVRLFVTKPLHALLRLPAWVSAGKAAMKAEIAAQSATSAETLPWNEAVLAQIATARAEGRNVVLCTASDHATAERIAANLGSFDEVIASDGQTNLAGAAKAQALVARFGDKGFDYIGNSAPDLKVWRHANRALVVSNDTTLIDKTRALCPQTEVLPAPKASARAWVKQLRLHQWAKNALIFVPVIAAQEYGALSHWARLFAAFVTFGIIASTTYVLNDLFDLDADRRHASKRFRPLARGTISTLQAALFIPAGLALGLGLAALIGPAFVMVTLSYVVATVLYSFSLKKQVLIDCLWLAGLFTIRIVAGSLTIGAQLSPWLLMFSIFLFLSLAYLKRYVELRDNRGKGKGKVAGRGYSTADLPMVFALGNGAGYASTIVLSLYLFSPEALLHYSNPFAIVVAVPILLFWMSHMWLQAHRGLLHHDPVFYALTDRTSQIAIGLFFVVFFAGAHIGA